MTFKEKEKETSYMKRYIARWIVGWVLFSAVGLGWAGETVQTKGRELLQDLRFARGFSILSPQHGKRIVVRKVRFRPDLGEPIWNVAQWNSRFSLADVPLEHLPGDVWRLADRSKTVMVRHPGRPDAELVLGVDSRPEYDHPRRQGEPWPHLLVQQSIQGCPPLPTLKAIRLRLRARLTRNEVFRGKGYNRMLHCAQCPLVLIIQNRNRGSAGFGDFFWFEVPLFDDRWPFPPPHIARDTADPSAKLIYNPGLKAFTHQTLADGRWVDLDINLLPQIRKGLHTAWEKGYLQGSQDEADYRIVSFILGWEVPGRNRAEIRFRNLSLQAIPAAK